MLDSFDWDMPDCDTSNFDMSNCANGDLPEVIPSKGGALQRDATQGDATQENFLREPSSGGESEEQAIQYDPDKTYPVPQDKRGPDIEGPHGADEIQLGDQIQFPGSNRKRKVRAVRTDEKTGFVRSIYLVKIRQSEFPSPVTKIPRSRLRLASIIQRRSLLWDTSLSRRLQSAIRDYMKALTKVAYGNSVDIADIEDQISQEEVVGRLS